MTTALSPTISRELEKTMKKFLATLLLASPLAHGAAGTEAIVLIGIDASTEGEQSIVVAGSQNDCKYTGVVQRNTIGKSALGRPVYQWSITATQANCSDGASRPITLSAKVYMTPKAGDKILLVPSE
ncbi:hypothetical protein [Cupriavidus sp. TMH.W2]|uniref:hypothetical protein n=1 Tax=Cupriavidus sp. TMH.W2 TaxID=3434465 RepID=UPI003D786788